MLPAASRVRHSADFAATLKRGRRARRGAVVVYVSHRAPNNESGRPAVDPAQSGSDGTRAGFIVSKAVGVAVVRNKVKRRLRHAVAGRLPGWPAGLDVVVRALPEAADADFRRLDGDVEAAFLAAHRRRR